MPRAVRTRAYPDADARVLRALAEPTRERILRMLGDGELTAGAIAAGFDSARPTISKHLRVLREAGLVRVRASGRERYYSIAPANLRDAAARVKALDEWLREAALRLDAHVREAAKR